MSLPLTVNAITYSYPETGDTNWGVQATAWANAVTVGMLQRAGGSFTLTNEVDFGATYGLMSAYYKTRHASIATTGILRMGRTDEINWRNQADGANLPLAVNSSNILTFNGEVIPAGLIVNADIDAAAAIAFSKMAALTVSRGLVTDGSGVIVVSNASAAQVNFLSTVTSDVQVQLDARLPLAGGTMTGDLFLNADPTATNQAATKNYVDNASAGNVNNFTVRLASTAAVNLANELENGDTLDGVVIATGDLILVKNQVSTAANGIYVAPASGAASRYTGMDTWTEAIGASVFATEGTANAGTLWKFNTAAGGTLGVTAIPIVQLGSSQVYTADGEGLELSGTEFALELDGATLTKGGSGLKVTDLGIANAQIAAAAAIAVNKLAALTASRAVVSDGSGFITPATTTATEIGYVNGVTSAIQTQITARIAATLLTTRGDMIYASAANTPARLAVGTSTYALLSDGTDPVWTDQAISFTLFSATSGFSIGTTWASFTLASATLTAGTPWTRATNVLTATKTGIYRIEVSISNIDTSAAAERKIMVRLRNTTDSTTMAVSTCTSHHSSSHKRDVDTFVMFANISNLSKAYEIQIACSGTGVTIFADTVDSQASDAWVVAIERIRQ